MTKSKDRLLGDLEILQKIIEDAHPAPANYLSRKELSRLFDSLRHSIDRSLTLRKYYSKIQFLADKLGCSHTSVSLPEEVMDTLYNRAYFFPLPLILVGNRLLVNSDHDLPHGTEILSVRNIKAGGLLEDLAFYNPVEGRHRNTQIINAAADFGFQYYLRYGAAPVFSVRIKDTLGATRDTLLDAVNLSDLRSRQSQVHYYDATDVPFSLKINEEYKYALLRLPSFDFPSDNVQSSYEEFLKNSFDLLDKRKDCRELIIDLRENTGGYLYGCFLLFSYLADAPFREYKAVTTRTGRVPFTSLLSGGLTYDDADRITQSIRDNFKKTGNKQYEYRDSLNDVWKPDKNRFRYRVYVITNAKVMSAATYFCTLVQNSGRGKIVGIENAGGANSGNGFELLEYRLPTSGIHLVFPYARILYTYGSAKTGRGVIPDYIVPDTDSSFMKNQDTQVRFIIDSLLSK